MGAFRKVGCILLLALSACAGTMERLEKVGKAPPLTAIGNPIQKPGHEVYWPESEHPVMEPRHVNSLWQPGSAAFFKDRRARRVGDILRVAVLIKDKAQLDNKTTRSRTTGDKLEAPNFLGYESYINKVLPGAALAESLLDVTGDSSTEGTGKVDRKETIELQVAAMVTQILPNGNLVVRGNQQTRVNYEVREITVEGIVRPEDITAENTVDYNQIAEARISYGGQGQLSDLQQPRIGTQIIDAIAPF